MSHGIVMRLREAAIGQEEGRARLLIEAAEAIEVYRTEFDVLQQAALAGMQQMNQAMVAVTDSMRLIGVNFEVLRLRDTDATLCLKDALVALKAADRLLTDHVEGEKTGGSTAVTRWRHEHVEMVTMADQLLGGSNG